MSADETAWPKNFEAASWEPLISKAWEAGGVFRPSEDPTRTPFSIAMPPPNATGTLHLGHGVMLALQDAMARWRRLCGDAVLWLPGTDHAAIATESVVIRQLNREGIRDPRRELGRAALVERIARYVEGSRATIREQIRAVGASCDWSRERYTMDRTLNRCVDAVFARMFRDGLIYRGQRLVNWDPVLETTVSDDELETVERTATLYTLRYGPLLVATSRPETKLGDTAVAVHPDDERWRHLVGKRLELTWPRGHRTSVRVIADPEVDPTFGSGAVGVTPAHSPVDFELAARHRLPLVQVIDEQGRMTEAAGPYAGLTVLACRAEFVADLKEAGLIVSEEVYRQSVSVCYRSGEVVESLPKAQWFIDVDRPAVSWQGQLMSLRQVMREVVERDVVRFQPEHAVRTYLNWVDGLRDWCISRQIFWGHQIPVWYRENGELHVGHGAPHGEGWHRDPDTLDTWFSSALWTWSTLVEPAAADDPSRSLEDLLAASPDFHRFHPTSVMETGHDILFFWVARMVLMTTCATGQVPFRTVYLHGLVLDDTGEKMSKSRPEKCIDPLDVIAEHGADTLRLALVMGNAVGQDLRLGRERLTACRRFVNKLWNAGRLLPQLGVGSLAPGPTPPTDHPLHAWFLERVETLCREVEEIWTLWRPHAALERIWQSFWHELCDLYLEALKSADLRGREDSAAVLGWCFGRYLELLHPFAPFVTEVMWRQLGGPGLLAGGVRHPVSPAKVSDRAAGEALPRLVRALRRARAQTGTPPTAEVTARVAFTTPGPAWDNLLPVARQLLPRTRIVIVDQAAATAGEASGIAEVDAAFTAVLEVSGDRGRERESVAADIDETLRRLEALRARLDNPQFTRQARPEVVDQTRRQATEAEHRLEGLRRRHAQLAPTDAELVS